MGVPCTKSASLPVPDPFFFFFQEAQEVVDTARATRRMVRVMVRKFMVVKETHLQKTSVSREPSFATIFN
jgi:hypothetical protein